MENTTQIGSVEMVTNILHNCGITANLNGYHYLRRAIVDTYEDPTLMTGVTKRLYVQVGKKYGVSRNSVERSMRYAIECGANSIGGSENMRRYIGEFDDAPSVTKFIFGVVDYLCLQGNHLPMFNGDPKVLT